MLRAVLFDWGDTLMQDAWSEEIWEAGARAGLAALAGREDLPQVPALADWWARAGTVQDPRAEVDRDLVGLTRRCFSDLGCELSDDDVDAYMHAAHRSWRQHVAVAGHAHALLEALRGRGLKVGIVSNVGSPGKLVREFLDEQGFVERVDSVVLSIEVGKRKPHPAIFERALDELGVAGDQAMYVGDRRYNDVGGAHAVGMTTVQAMWFFADPDEEGPEPDHVAFTMFDVLNIADRALAA